METEKRDNDEELIKKEAVPAEADVTQDVTDKEAIPAEAGIEQNVDVKEEVPADSENEQDAEAKEESPAGTEVVPYEAKNENAEMDESEAFFAAVLAGMCYVSFYDWQEKKELLNAKKKLKLFEKNEDILKSILIDPKFSKAFGEFLKKQGKAQPGCELEKPKNYRDFREKMLSEFTVLSEDGLQTDFWLGTEGEKGYIARKFDATNVKDAGNYIYTLIYVLEKVKSSVRNDDKALKEIGKSLGMDEAEIEKIISYHRKTKGAIWNWIVAGVITVSVLLLAWGVFWGIRHYKMMKAFQSFDLSKLSQEEFIFQTIEFKKFVPYGTNGDFSVIGNIKLNSLSEYVDELQIYYVSGRADVMFRHLDENHLVINEKDSDYDKKILRMDYKGAGQSPFDVEVAINDKEIYQVYKKMSKKAGGIDFVKADKSPNEVVSDAKERLTAEFKAQLQTELAKPEELKKSELYQDFLKQFTKMVSAVSDWEQVEINFGGR